MAQTELPGDVVLWGADHKEPSAAACCASCANKMGCNTWVWCSNERECAGTYQECWLKKRTHAWDDVDVLEGRSTKWTSGVLGSPPSLPILKAADGRPCDFAFLMLDGLVRLRIRDEAPNAARYIRDLLSEMGSLADDAAMRVPEPGALAADGLRFYRAEPVPKHWGSLEWPDNYFGGRWGPPYALLQGSLHPQGSKVRPSAADFAQGARPVIRRGFVAWAGGRGGPDFFIALAQHPEWGNGHTVFAEVFPEDMAVIDALMRRPLRVANWGSINATELVKPMPFRLLGPSGARAVRDRGVSS